MYTESCNALNAGRTERFRRFGENTIQARHNRRYRRVACAAIFLLALLLMK